MQYFNNKKTSFNLFIFLLTLVLTFQFLFFFEDFSVKKSVFFLGTRLNKSCLKFSFVVKCWAIKKKRILPKNSTSFLEY